MQTEVLFSLMVFANRWLGVHAHDVWTCRLYTFLLLMHLPMHGFSLPEQLCDDATMFHVVVNDAVIISLSFISSEEEN